MQERIVIQYNSFADPAMVAAFQDSLAELLTDEGSVVEITTQKVRPFALGGQQFRVEWHGDYRFSSPDGQFKFESKDLMACVETTDLDFDTYTKLVSARSQALAAIYRQAMSEVFALTVEMATDYRMPNDMSSIQYLRETMRSAVAALPRNH